MKGVSVPKTYTKANAGVREFVDAVMEEYHPELHGANVRIGILMVQPSVNDKGQPTGPAISFHGHSATACIKIASTKDRTIHEYDAIMQIDEERWTFMPEEQRTALIDHELSHLKLEYEGGNVVKTHDDLRPVLKSQPDDFMLTGFHHVIERHGKHALEAQSLGAVIAKHAQLEFDFKANAFESAA